MVLLGLPGGFELGMVPLGAVLCHLFCFCCSHGAYIK